MASANLDYEIRTFGDGQDVVPYLLRKGKYHDERTPDIMFLDLSLQKKDGFEVLMEMMEQPGYVRNLPIVILTGDSQCTFLTRSYGLRIAAYVNSPARRKKYVTRWLP